MIYLIFMVASCYLYVRSLAQTATISVGDLHQYLPAAATQSIPNGTTVLYSGDDTQGVNVTFSPALQLQIQTTFNSSCQNITEACIQAIRDDLVSPKTDVQARAVVSAYLVFEVLQAIGAALTVFMTLLAFEFIRTVPAQIRIPPYQVHQASLGMNASVTVFSIANNTPLTITPTPYPTTVTGSITPAATTYTAATGSHNQGDVLISLSSELAARMSDFIHMSAYCPAGITLDSTTAKRALDFGDVLCGAEGIVVNAIPGGPFADFRLINVQPLPFTNADAIRAMNAAMTFARGFAANLQLNPDQAALLGVAAFAISWALWNGGQALGMENVIPAKELAGTVTKPPSPSSTSSETCSVCFASCGFVGPIQMCETECSETSVCTSSATGGGLWGINNGGEEVLTTTTVAYTAYGTYTGLYTSNTTSASASMTSIPIRPGGPQSLPPPPPSTSLSPTTPAPSPSPPPPPPPPPKPTPSLGPQNCNGADDFGKHPDIHEDTLVDWINKIICKNDETFDASSKALDWNPVKFGGKKDIYHFRISWIEGCEATTSQQKRNPLPGSTCFDLLYNDYKDCFNNGVGGWRDAGCLRYEQNPMTA